MSILHQMRSFVVTTVHFRFLLVVVAALLASPAHEAQAQGPMPLSPTEEEVATHMIGTVPVIRMDSKDFPEFPTIGAVPVELIVNEHGKVISARLEDEDDDGAEDLTKSQRALLRGIVTEAETTGLALQFRPFENQGRPVQARFEIQIPIRDLNEKPAKHIPFPQIHNWSSVKIVLSRTGCYGTCSSYRVEIHGDGTVLYDGGSYVAISGSHRASIASDGISAIVEAFRVADFFSLKDEYMWGATDLPTYTTSISFDGRTKEVIDYAGEHVGMPESVSKLEETIDHFSGVERWTKGNSETVPALISEKFDFKSPEASEILANVAQKGNVDAVRDLIAAGVIVSTKPVGPRLGVPGTALENAAQRGNVEMLQVLLSAGIRDSDAKTQALKRASSNGKIDAMRVLIGSGANPIAPDVLISAARSGIPSVVGEILKYRPDVNMRGQDGTTALIACLQAYHYSDADVNLREVVQILLDAGADPNGADKKGVTPLIANSRDIEIAQMLIGHGANVNAQASDGFTPLLNAETVELTRLLLKNGADPFAQTLQGETALDWAKRMNRKSQAALLQSVMSGKTQ